SNFYDVVACTNFALLQHAKVESWSVMGYEQGRHPRFIGANTDTVAGDAWLCYFEYSTTNAVAIADADLVIRKPVNREVFSELPEAEVITSEKALPVMIGVHLINKHCALLATVTGEIALGVTINIERARHSPSRDRKFPDCGADGFAVPCHLARKTDIY